MRPRLLAFTCKGRHLCPACHQRRVRQTADWIATAVCHEVPHRQFVFTIPKILRGIFRKRRDLLHLLFKTATILRFRAGSFEWQASGKPTDAKNALRSLGEEGPRTRLNLPDGKLGAIAAVHTFGDYLIFHPHLHALREAKLISPKKLQRNYKGTGITKGRAINQNFCVTIFFCPGNSSS